jgi:hypothetical protein
MPFRALLIAFLFLSASPQVQPRLPVHVESLVYPPLARQARIMGTVVAIAHIAADGTVSVPTIKYGHPLLATAAEENLSKWKFQSGEAQQLEITYHFIVRNPKPRDDPETECQFDLPDSVTVSIDPPPVQLSQ